jgi:hypothetical protein
MKDTDALKDALIPSRPPAQRMVVFSMTTEVSETKRVPKSSAGADHQFRLSLHPHLLVPAALDYFFRCAASTLLV